MNPQLIVDHLKPRLIARGWQDVDVAVSLEPDPDVTEVPVALVFRGAVKPVPGGGDTSYDNFVAQTMREHIGIQIAALPGEIETRRDELFEELLGVQLAGQEWPIKYAEGAPLLLTRSIEWFLDMFYQDVHRRQT